jgi:ribonuclease HII
MGNSSFAAPGAIPLHEIRRMLASPTCNADLLDGLRTDPREQVASLVDAAERRRHRLEAEHRSHREMLAIERELQATGRFLIAGVDEVGVGPLAGPIVAAAVILGDASSIEGIMESKKLDSARRSSVASEIRTRAVGVAIGIATAAEIDELNVYHAGLLAMRRAVEALPKRPDHVIVDARRIPDIGIEQSSYLRGDARSLSIAAASIIARTHRDALMEELDRTHPGYGFSRHKGYGTPEHHAALRRLGASAIHRSSYEAVRELTSSGRQHHD